MYMFSYDRQALWDLFDFFLQLRWQGKNIYIMAGNHDWLNQHFVYHEGKKITDILMQNTAFNRDNTNKIHFITEPSVQTIDWKDILFMPYNKKFLGDYAGRNTALHHTTHNDWSNDNTTNHTNEATSGFFSSTSEWQTIESIRTETQTLLKSTNYNEQLSGALNHYLLEHYKEWMTLIHHYYTAKTPFPWQQAQFDYKDIALHPSRMSIADRVISWHLHKAFSYKNYLCTWSVWNTTSGERNQCKRLRRWDTLQDRFESHEIAINPYISTTSTNISLQGLHTEMTDIRNEHKMLFDTSITIAQESEYDMAVTSLILYSPESISTLETSIDSELKSALWDIQIKQTSSQKDMTELLDISQYNIKQSLLDWKELVKKYLLSRYWDESEKYRTVLSELNIL